MTVTPLARDNTFRAGFAEGKEVSYNGVKFPPAIHATGSYEPAYDDAGRIRKYIRGKLQIEAILYPGCLDTPIGNVIPYYKAVSDSVGVTSIDDGNSHDFTTDTTM